jgi:hypothetical protein
MPQKNLLLHQAAEKGDFARVKELIAEGADIISVDKHGNTSLHLAAKRAHIEIVKFLISEGADVNLENNESKIPYDLYDKFMDELENLGDLLLGVKNELNRDALELEELLAEGEVQGDTDSAEMNELEELLADDKAQRDADSAEMNELEEMLAESERELDEVPLVDEKAQWVLVSELKKQPPPEKYFFPIDLSRDEIPDELLQNSYARFLIALEEPKLYREKFLLVFRFLWLRTFNEPMSFRFYQMERGDYKLVVKMTSGKGGFEAGDLKMDQRMELSEPQGKALVEKIVIESNFWNLPRESPSFGLDGSFWIFEGMMEGKYHVINRWTPKSPKIQEIGRMFIEYSGLNINNIY